MPSRCHPDAFPGFPEQADPGFPVRWTVDVDDVNQLLYRTHVLQKVKMFDDVEVLGLQLRGDLAAPLGPANGP